MKNRLVNNNDSYDYVTFTLDSESMTNTIIAENHDNDKKDTILHEFNQFIEKINRADGVPTFTDNSEYRGDRGFVKMYNG